MGWFETTSLNCPTLVNMKGDPPMDLERLNQQLENATELYRFSVNDLMDSFIRMDKGDRYHFLPEALDLMNRAAYYTFIEFQDNIMRYLREANK
jgi:hypothetical protein